MFSDVLKHKSMLEKQKERHIFGLQSCKNFKFLFSYMVKLFLIASLAFTTLNGGGGDDPKKDASKAKSTTEVKKKSTKKATTTKQCCEGKAQCKKESCL